MSASEEAGKQLIRIRHYGPVGFYRDKMGYDPVGEPDLPPGFVERIKDNFRSIAGKAVLRLLEDGRDYRIFMQWRNERKNPALTVLCLLTNPFQCEVGEFMLRDGINQIPGSYQDIEYQKIHEGIRRFERLNQPFLMEDDESGESRYPEHIWKRVS